VACKLHDKDGRHERASYKLQQVVISFCITQRTAKWAKKAEDSANDGYIDT